MDIRQHLQSLEKRELVCDKKHALGAAVQRVIGLWPTSARISASHRDNLTGLVRLRQLDGYKAELVAHPQRVKLVENHCPTGVATF